jgi:hypothetical protein
MIDDEMLSKMRSLDRDRVDTRVRPSDQSRKTMVTLFFRVNGTVLVKIQPESRKSTSEYFKDQVVREI